MFRFKYVLLAVGVLAWGAFFVYAKDIVNLPIVRSSGTGNVSMGATSKTASGARDAVKDLLGLEIDSLMSDSSWGSWSTGDIDMEDYSGLQLLFRLNNMFIVNDSHPTLYDTTSGGLFAIVSVKTADIRGKNDITVITDTLTDTGNLTFWLGKCDGFKGKDSLRGLVYISGIFEDTCNQPYYDTINTVWYYDVDITYQKKR